ncbi:hypothetical protein LCGC14_1067630 [marine sediment metagenome]|uniref:arginine--tRNA ligase n=1 Tax=marine sediment metagenome TaxID=412755 RepID=A0A0F9QQ29_9ZZZZ
MNIFQIYQQLLVDTIKKLQKESKLLAGLDLRQVSTQPPRNSEHGDIASNVALVLSKQAMKSPMDLAQLIADNLFESEWTKEVNVIEPGFINFTINDDFWIKLIHYYNNDFNYPFLSNIGGGEKILMEYVSANPTGPLHIGHARGGIYGDALANLLEAVGYKIKREYYVNDAGNQIQKLEESIYAASRGHEIPEDGYHGEYIKELSKMPGDPIENIMEWIKKDLSELGIEFDNFVSEMDILVKSTNVEIALGILKKNDLIYTDDSGATFFKSTKFGDDKDRVIIKSTGENTYFVGDVAYHLNKIHRGYDKLINVFGVDHSGYVTRIKSVVEALSEGKTEITIELVDLLFIMRDGKLVGMSKRHANYITLRDVLDEVGKDALRIMMLMQTNTKTINFDLDKVIEQSSDNPVWYMQYAHARTCSIMRRLKEFPELESQIANIFVSDYSFTQTERELIKKLSQWQYLVEGAACKHEPHLVAIYLYDLATVFHRLWSEGRDKDKLFIMEDNPELTALRVKLVTATQKVIKAGMEIIGVTPMEKL